MIIFQIGIDDTKSERLKTDHLTEVGLFSRTGYFVQVMKIFFNK